MYLISISVWVLLRTMLPWFLPNSSTTPEPTTPYPITATYMCDNSFNIPREKFSKLENLRIFYHKAAA